MKLSTGLNFINVLCTAFKRADPESVKRYWWLNCTFLRFWDLWVLKLYVECWWNWHLTNAFFFQFFFPSKNLTFPFHSFLSFLSFVLFCLLVYLFVLSFCLFVSLFLLITLYLAFWNLFVSIFVCIFTSFANLFSYFFFSFDYLFIVSICS